MLSFAQPAQLALLLGGLSIPAGFALHEDELYIVFDDGVGLEWLAQELCGAVHLVVGIGDLMPNDRIKVVKTDSAANHTEVRVEWDDHMTTKAPALKANVPNDTDQTDYSN